jgi:hypothetical protein
VLAKSEFRTTLAIAKALKRQSLSLFKPTIAGLACPDICEFSSAPMTERVRMNRLVLIHVVGIRGVHPCTLVDFWGDGATLHSSTYHTAAFEFDLSLDGFRTTRHCHVLWRAGNICGVEFVSPATIEPQLAS